MSETRPPSTASRLGALRTRASGLRSRVRAPAVVTRGSERWERTTIPRPRILGLLAGIVGLLVLLLLSQLVFGGIDLGDDGPAPNPYFDQ